MARSGHGLLMIGAIEPLRDRRNEAIYPPFFDTGSKSISDPSLKSDRLSGTTPIENVG